MAEGGRRKNLIVPLAGGKGGTGKSLVAANLALALARQKVRTLIVDLDLGASNLHTLLGLKNVKDGLGRLLLTKGMMLEEVVHETPWSGLSYIPGDNQVLRSANPHHTQKEKIISGLKRLPFDLVMTDLGAGSAANLLDFFLASPTGLVVFTAELPSLLNAYSFLRQALFRALSLVLRDNHYALQVLEEYRASPGVGPQSWTLERLLERMAQKTPGQEKRVQKVLGWWRPGLILNQVRRQDDLKAFGSLAGLIRAKLSVEPLIMGALPHDPAVLESLRERRPVQAAHPDCLFSQGLDELAARLPGWRPTSLERLLQRAQGWNLAQGPEDRTDPDRLNRLLAEVLPVADDLSRALAEARRTGQEGLAQGLAATLKNHLERLALYGLAPIPTQGREFDPHLHQAVATQARAGTRPGLIVAEVSMGFTLGGRLFRPAQVVVAE